LIVQAGTILILAFARPEIPPQAASRPRSAIDSSHQFITLWFFAWVSWLLLYTLLSFVEFKLLTESLEVHVLRDAFNLLNACCLFLCYKCMVARSTGPDKQQYHVFATQFLIAACALIILEYLVALPFAKDKQAVDAI